MAGEGGGVGVGGAVTGVIPALVKIFQKPHRSTYDLHQAGQAWASQQQAARALPTVERPNVALPRTAALVGLGQGLVAPRDPQPAYPPPAQQQQTPAQQPVQLGDYLAAAQRGIERGMAISALISYIRSLFAKPQPLNISLGGYEPMPYNFMPSSFGGSEFLTGAGTLAGGIASIISAIRSPQNMPGGLSFVPPGVTGIVARSLPSILGGTAAGAAAGGLAEWLAGGSGGGCPTSPFIAGGSTARPTIFVQANPATGKATWFRPAGRPILWSSDLSACRRVRKVAGRARRRLGGR